MVEHIFQLFHVHPAHVLREAGRRRLLPHEFLRRLTPVSERQLGRGEQFRSLLDHGQQFGCGHLAQHLPRPRRLAHISRHETRIGLAHFGNRLARVEVNDLVELETLVGAPPPQDRKMDHVAAPRSPLQP